jgi:hypothetical protein
MAAMEPTAKDPSPRNEESPLVQRHSCLSSNTALNTGWLWAAWVVFTLVALPVLAEVVLVKKWADQPVLLFCVVGVLGTVFLFLGMVVYGAHKFGFHLHDVVASEGQFLAADTNDPTIPQHPLVQDCSWLLVQDTFCAPYKIIMSISRFCSTRGSTQRALLAAAGFSIWAIGFLASAIVYQTISDPTRVTKAATFFSLLGNRHGDRKEIKRGEKQRRMKRMRRQDGKEKSEREWI